MDLRLHWQTIFIPAAVTPILDSRSFGHRRSCDVNTEVVCRDTIILISLHLHQTGYGLSQAKQVHAAGLLT